MADELKATTRRCTHLEDGTFVKHSTLTLRTVPREDNTTSYEWFEELELCVLCSGVVRGGWKQLPEALANP